MDGILVMKRFILQAVLIWADVSERANSHPTKLPTQPQGQHYLCIKGQSRTQHKGVVTCMESTKCYKTQQ